MPKRALDAKVMLHSIRLLRSAARALGHDHALIDFEVELTRLVGLFDRDHYLSQIDPATLRGMTPLRHFVVHGDQIGLSPSPLFDIGHYDAHCGPRHGINRLLHYGLIAHFKGLSPTPWFDVDYYLRTNPDVGSTPLQALAHFQRWGWREGRNPLPGLDMRRLLNLRPELRMVKGSALALFGSEWMSLYMQGDTSEAAARAAEAARHTREPDMLDLAQWAQVHARKWSVEPVVDVLVPVYGGLQETLRCLFSVLTAPVRTPHRLIVINDAGPVPELNAMLRSLAARDLFVLEQHRANLGFVKTVNHGLRISRDRDVVILNSDTVVYNDWLDRLLAHAAEHPRLASVTPLSNNATICSYPETLGENRLPLELAPHEIDQLASQVNRLVHVKVPTGVGFCMYMRRTTLDEIGPLDERSFGRGYGEENDWCQRALRRGWSNAIACDVYVRHVGSVSFKGEALERTQLAMKTLARLHPQYDADVARYIAEDPTWRYRLRLDLARLARRATDHNVLLVCHNRGGGTERHLLEQSRELMDQGFGVFELRPSSVTDRVALLHPGLYNLPNLANLQLRPLDLLIEALQVLRIRELHIHHLIDFPTQTAEQLMEAADRLGLTVRLAVHDYYALCPRVNLINAEGRFCGQPAPEDCNRCLSQDGLIQQTGPIEAWRTASQKLLVRAEEVIVPSADVARRIATLGGGAIRIAPHEADPPPRVSASVLVPEGRPVKVLAIGAINRIKGFDVLAGLALTARAHDLPLEVSLLGYSSDDVQLAAAGVRLLGRYFDNELLERISAFEPDLIFVPSVWPETYCYVLSAAMLSGCRIVVFDLGAQAERTRQHDPHHLVVPLPLADSPAELADLLLRSTLAPGALGASPVQSDTTSDPAL
ncbi:glycosyltransferase [Ideonella sp.]|uniref:glycosyltransferase n=1 Tax=Ideonella sp. TaxID=1929293 RepID=UPI003BB737CD